MTRLSLVVRVQWPRAFQACTLQAAVAVARPHFPIVVCTADMEAFNFLSLDIVPWYATSQPFGFRNKLGPRFVHFGLLPCF
jgi:hypothetical protein